MFLRSTFAKNKITTTESTKGSSSSKDTRRTTDELFETIWSWRAARFAPTDVTDADVKLAVDVSPFESAASERRRSVRLMLSMVMNINKINAVASRSAKNRESGIFGIF